MMNITKIFAGSVIMASVLLAHFHNEYWLFLTFFVGINLFQFGITNFCPFEIIMKKLGYKRE